MARREMTAEEADDFISEHGTGVTPMQVYNEEQDAREDQARRPVQALADLAYDSIRQGAPGLSDATCRVIAGSIARKVLAQTTGTWPEKWSGDCTVGNLIANLASLPPDMPVYTGYHIQMDGKSHLKVKRPTVSRERVEGTNIKTGDDSVPYSAVIWTHPREPDPEGDKT